MHDANADLSDHPGKKYHDPDCAYFHSYPVSEGSQLVPCDCGAWEEYEVWQKSRSEHVRTR